MCIYIYIYIYDIHHIIIIHILYRRASRPPARLPRIHKQLIAVPVVIIVVVIIVIITVVII